MLGRAHPRGNYIPEGTISLIGPGRRLIARALAARSCGALSRSPQRGPGEGSDSHCLQRVKVKLGERTAIISGAVIVLQPVGGGGPADRRRPARLSHPAERVPLECLIS